MIELRNISLKYGTQQILDEISMTARDREITAVLGPSGSGKSTILKLMLGLIGPASGEVLVDGVVINGRSEQELFPIRKKMGMVFQGNALFDSLSVERNLGFFLGENLKLPQREIAERVREQMAFAGLEGYGSQLPDSLSGGMQKRLAIGRALIFDPCMVLLDEPTVGLDPLSSRKVLDVIKKLREEKGLGAVMVTHIIGDVFAIADRVVVLYQGKIIFDDLPERLHHCSHHFIESFLTEGVEG
jgi:phospholipid/cholesterol/gamma-HCH transport system ATP-binding protein